MPVLTLYQSGMKMGCAPGENSHPRALRGKVDGWSVGSIRRNTDFLKSVDVSRLDGDGYALTLSVGKIVPTPEDFRAMFRSWVERVRRMGMVRLHWVIEWQRRGAPHLHVAVYFPSGALGRFTGAHLVNAWLDSGASSTGAEFVGQCAKAIDGPVGWLQYLAKHASRGAAMYQRSSAAVPSSWRGRTGRLWGKVGEWPVGAVVRLSIESNRGDGGYYALRRMVRGWRLADSRADPLVKNRPRRIQLARRMLQSSDKMLCRVRGPSEWLDIDTMLRMMENLVERGYSVASYLSAKEAKQVATAGGRS